MTRLPKLFFDLIAITQPRGKTMAKLPITTGRHIVQRISPLGDMFIGKCLACGKERLSLEMTVEECEQAGSVSIGDVIRDMIVAKQKEKITKQ